MQRLLLFLIVLTLSACASIQESLYSEPALITLSETQDGKWIMTTTLEKPQQHFIMLSSKADYRTETWKVLTPGRLERYGKFDSLHFDEPVTRFRIEISPKSGTRGFRVFPYHKIGESGLILMSHQFLMVTALSEDSVRNLNQDQSNWYGNRINARLKILTSKKAYFGGNEVNGLMETPIGEDDAFIYIGHAPITEHANFKGIIDPRLPRWIIDDFDQTVGRLVETHTELFGKPLKNKPYLFLSSADNADSDFSYDGLAFGEEISILNLGGKAIRIEARLVKNHIRFFYSHEISHLFQNIDDSSSAAERVAWMAEGSANLMGYQALSKAGLVDDGFISAEINSAFRGCKAFMSGELTPKRNRHYDCGLIAALATQATLPDQTLYEFWNTLVAGAARNDDQYDLELYIKTVLKSAPRDNRLQPLTRFIEYISTAPNMGRKDQTELLYALLEGTQLSPTYNANKDLLSLDWK